MGQRETKEPIMSSQLLAFFIWNTSTETTELLGAGERSAKKWNQNRRRKLAHQLPREETRERGSQLAFLPPFSGPLFGEAGLARVFSF